MSKLHAMHSAILRLCIASWFLINESFYLYKCVAQSYSLSKTTCMNNSSGLMSKYEGIKIYKSIFANALTVQQTHKQIFARPTTRKMVIYEQIEPKGFEIILFNCTHKIRQTICSWAGGIKESLGVRDAALLGNGRAIARMFYLQKCRKLSPRWPCEWSWILIFFYNSFYIRFAKQTLLETMNVNLNLIKCTTKEVFVYILRLSVTSYLTLFLSSFRIEIKIYFK